MINSILLSSVLLFSGQPLDFPEIWKSAKDLFSAGYIRTPNLPQDKLLAMFGAKKGSYRVSNNRKQWIQ